MDDVMVETAGWGGSIAGVYAGAEAGAYLGAFAGPYVEVAVPTLTIAGGVVGGFVGEEAIQDFTKKYLDSIPNTWNPEFIVAGRFALVKIKNLKFWGDDPWEQSRSPSDDRPPVNAPVSPSSPGGNSSFNTGQAGGGAMGPGGEFAPGTGGASAP